MTNEEAIAKVLESILKNCPEKIQLESSMGVRFVGDLNESDEGYLIVAHSQNHGTALARWLNEDFKGEL